jgi:hypothetical protein
MTLPEPRGLLIKLAKAGEPDITIWHLVRNDGLMMHCLNKKISQGKICKVFNVPCFSTFRSCKMALYRKIKTFSSQLEVMALDPLDQS